MANVKLIGASTCGNCRMIHSKLEEAGIEHDYILADNEEGLEVARKYNVSSVPVLVVDEKKISTVGEIIAYIKGKK